MDDDGQEGREEQVAQRLEDVAPPLAHLNVLDGKNVTHIFVFTYYDETDILEEKPCLVGDLPTHLCGLRGEDEDARGEHEGECEAGRDGVAFQVEEERREDVRRLKFMGIQCFN